MAKHTTTNVPAPRVIHYLQPTQATHPVGAELLLYTAAQLAARRHERELAYAQWAARQAAIAERDRRTRRVVGVVALVLIAACSALGWMAYRAVTTTPATVGVWIGALALGALALLGLVVGGRRCVTIIEHRH